MTIYGWLIFALWFILVAYWALATAAVMRTSGSRWIWWREITIRLGLFALVVLVLRVAVVGLASPDAPLTAFDTSAPLGLVGLVTATLGSGLAVLARRHLGRNWGLPMSNPTNRELVTSGPYALVRHPIYGGLLLAMLGSAAAQSILWLLPLIVYGPYFILSALREEKLLIEQFPERYPAYSKRTKMLLPFLF